MRTLPTTHGIGRIALAALFSLGLATTARGQCPQGGLSGSVDTCTEDGGQPAGSAFDQPCDVYLCAKPAGGGPSSGLPAGEYVFQITDPSGATLLSLDGPQNGVLTKATKQGGFTAYAGSHQTAGQGASADLRVQLCPFTATPNPGGVYKVWLTPRDCYESGKGTFGFLPSKSKTHTFKVSGAPVAEGASLVIERFCDSDADGSPAGETFQSGVRYMVSVSSIDDGQPFEVTTGDAGAGTTRLEDIPVPATYAVQELVPGASEAGCFWWGTTPAFAATAGAPSAASFTGSLEADELVTLSFGAAPVRAATDGMDRRDFLTGQGRKLLRAHDPQWRQWLEEADLVEADGSEFHLPGREFRFAYAHFAAWLQSKRSPNAAHILSTEAALTLLAERLGALDPHRVRVLRPDMATGLGTNTTTPRQLVEAAEAMIAADGQTPAGDRNAVAQIRLRDALAGINTRALPLLNEGCCEPVYP
ncbi:MAG: hypothetical protein ACYTG2_14245 [Planctomycetota bacterium]|jgi:hypothetical protein